MPEELYGYKPPLFSDMPEFQQTGPGVRIPSIDNDVCPICGALNDSCRTYVNRDTRPRGTQENEEGDE